MEQSLEDIIQQEIKAKGPMDLGRYMSLCLGHPTHGYYMTRDPFGVEGDFTTAPEISQVFGEMIAVWVINTWEQMGSPAQVTLLECGPGRGTLMSDVLRVIQKYPEVAKAVQVNLLEMSPVLQAKQKEALSACDVTWHQDLKTVPDALPVIVIGNEFLDALATRQLVHVEGAWNERVVTLDVNDTLSLSEVSADETIRGMIGAPLIPYRNGDVVEVSLEQKDFLRDLSKIALKQGGSVLFIDYGFTHHMAGDTLQAVRSHTYCNILETPGAVDITAHVNFARTSDQMMQAGLTVHGPVSQGDWLNRLNATIRFGQLIDMARQNGDDDTVQKLRSDSQRLLGNNTDKHEMGALFKVIAFTSSASINLAGFS